MFASDWLQRRSQLCLFVFTPRQGTLLTGILQTAINFIASTLMILTLKITIMMREKQLEDFEDHGADMDNLLRREDLPETNDMMRLWDAKVSNDLKIHAITLLIFFGLVNLTAYIGLTYCAVIKSARGMFVSIMVIGLNVLFFLITSAIKIITNSGYHVEIRRDGIEVQTLNIFPNNQYDCTVPWAFVLVVAFYSCCIGSGHLAIYKYYIQLRFSENIEKIESAEAVEITAPPENNSSMSCLDILTENPFRFVAQMMKNLRNKLQATKPTSV